MNTNANTTYVSIDIETTGLNPENCQILEIGESFALSIHPTILRRIATKEEGYTYVQPWEVATRFRDFPKEHGLDSENEKVSLAGKNYAGFDARFLRKLTNWDKHVKTHHRILDPAAMYWRPEIDGVELPNTKDRVAYYTSFVQWDTTSGNLRRSDSFWPWLLAGAA